MTTQPTLDQIDQHVRTAPPHAAAVHTDAGQLGFGCPAQAAAVITDDGQLIGHAQSAPHRGFHGAHCQTVIHTEQCGRRVGLRQHAIDRLPCGLDVRFDRTDIRRMKR